MADRRLHQKMPEDAVRGRQEVCSLALIGFLLLATSAAALSLHIVGRDFGPGTKADQTPRIGIDPNMAQWFELAQLPGVGESLARRIVQYRDSN